MEQLAFRTDSGSTYLVSFGRPSEGIDVIRISDHPVAGRSPRLASFLETFDAVEFLATSQGVRAWFKNRAEPSTEFVTSAITYLSEIATA